MSVPAWLTVTRGEAPLLVSLPHTGADLAGLEPRLVSPWLARKDADWYIEKLYDFVGDLDATVVRTSISRTVIDVNRDPSGASLYPGQATTGLCPTTSFDGEPLYRDGEAPDAAEIEARKASYFDPYHRALGEELARLRAAHGVVALYDCHSIRSVIPRLFEGELPVFNLGTNAAASADSGLVAEVTGILRASWQSHVVDGRFKGGWITRTYGDPARGVHALQMELACRSYLREPIGSVTEGDWPAAYDADFAGPTRAFLHQILTSVLGWTRRGEGKMPRLGPPSRQDHGSMPW
jgi:formiminoglutamase